MQCREVIQRMRGIRGETKILLASGYTGGENLAALTRLTGLELLHKPYDPDNVLRRVRSALDTEIVPIVG
jgi:DNA-binding response OmpR family regulator